MLPKIEKRVSELEVKSEKNKMSSQQIYDPNDSNFILPKYR